MLVSGITDYAIYLLSPEGIVSSWNAGAERFKGYAANEIIGQHFSRFYSAEDRANGIPERALKTALESGKFEAEGWRMRKDGSRFWASVVIDPIRDDAGNLLGFAKITRDITERKLAAEALHVSEERFRILVQGVTDYAIYMLSPAGVITNWNAGAKRIKGYDQAEVVGTHFSRFYTEEDRNSGLPAFALQKAANEGRFENEGWRVRKDGTPFWAHVVIDPLRSELGELIGFAKITRDITDKRTAALALEQTREQLFQAQKLEAIGKLTGGVAHDFNNLLNVVVNGIEMVQAKVQDEAILKILSSMQRAATRGATLTQQLLSFARQQPLKQEKHDINHVINSFEAVLRRASKGSVNFELKLGPKLPYVLIDAPQFEAALLNLIVNARDATPDHGTITLRTEAVTLNDRQVNNLPAGRYVKVSVMDTGIGMPSDVANRAVEPFFTTKPLGKGTGLGLSQVFGLAQQSNGDLMIESKVGQGTTVSLFFPALNEETDEMNKSVESPERALVVDDQEDVLAMAVELFRAMGYDVLAANNAEEALEVLDRHPDINVLFSDVMMPGMSGVELAVKVRERLPTTKIILASGYAGSSLSSQHANIHEFDFLSKPYTVSQIMKKLRAAS